MKRFVRAPPGSHAATDSARTAALAVGIESLVVGGGVLGVAMIALGITTTAIDRRRGEYPEPEIQGH